MRIPIAREGYPLIAALLLAAIVVPRLPALAFTRWILWPVLLLAINFFRDPDRTVPEEPGVVVSPADGMVIKVDAAVEPTFIGGPCTLVSIFMSPLDVHVNRVPVTGRVAHRAYKAGAFRMAFDHRASDDNEQMVIGVETGAMRFLVRQVAGFLARRIVCRVDVGDAVTIGQRFGIIQFGSRVDLYLPPEVQPRVVRGQRVYAGATAVGAFG